MLTDVGGLRPAEKKSVSYAEPIARERALAGSSLDGALQNLLALEKIARLVSPHWSSWRDVARCTQQWLALRAIWPCL